MRKTAHLKKKARPHLLTRIISFPTILKSAIVVHTGAHFNNQECDVGVNYLAREKYGGGGGDERWMVFRWMMMLMK